MHSLRKCGTAVLVLLAITSVADIAVAQNIENRSPSFQFLDHRADSPSANVQIYADRSDAMVLEDSYIEPHGPEFIRKWIEETYPQRLGETTVVLTRLRMEAIDAPRPDRSRELGQAQRSVPNANPLAFLVAGLMVAGIDKLRGHKEISASVSITVDGKPMSGDAVGTFYGGDFKQHAKEVLDYAIGKTYSQFNAFLYEKEEATRKDTGN